jgi:NAD(P)-dependent dehydrogenase (short-subunit alcohol dehydrogenase family)
MTTNRFDLTGKIAVVTGGTGTLGSVMCQELADAGATVCVMSQTELDTAEMADRINAAGGDAVALPADVLVKDSLQQAADRVHDLYGRVDILINGAGGNRSEATAVPGERTFFDLPEEALQWVFNLNLTGTVLASQVFGQMMTAQQQGVILNISSMASIQPLTRVVAYSAAKAAVNNFTQWLAVYMATEHHPQIRVNALAPGFFLAEQNRYLLLNDDDTLTERGQQIIDHTPMQRFGDPDDLIGTMLWLCSDASRFVTGTVIPVDGGFSAYSGV